MAHSAVLHAGTPSLCVCDPRGLAVRWVGFHRARVDEPLCARVDRAAYDSAGRRVGRWDPRLWAANRSSAGQANLSTVFSLSGQRLCDDSVDAGWSGQLPGENGLVACRWNARGHYGRVEYDPMARAVAVFEHAGKLQTCVERMTYGGADAAGANLAGRKVRHDDPAGSLCNGAFDLKGNLSRQTRRFLKGVNSPDWPERLAGRDALLEPGDSAPTSWRFAPTGEVIEQRDAVGNTRSSSHTLAGLLKQTRVQLAGQPAQTLFSELQYDAQNRLTAQTAGNGVTTRAVYADRDTRMLRLQASRATGARLQDLQYAYDPVGNITRIEDAALPVSHFNNQRVDPISTFSYDTLYRLIEATGRELARIDRGPDLPVFQCPIDSSRLSHYRQTYEYDAGGNLLKLSHHGTQHHSRTLVAATSSNRCLAQLNATPPGEADIAAAYDASGNLLQLQPGQSLEWDMRNQLHKVTAVARASAEDDSQVHIYDAQGLRVRKIRMTQSGAVTHTDEVRYLPGLEIRSNSATGETLHMISVEAGGNGVRILHWQSGKPGPLENDQPRYSLADHLGSSALEVDQQAQLISQESYYPFGGTSWWAGRSEIQAHYKVARYCGQERDATGLYYYGLRYYAPWLMRWCNPDPAGERGGINLFRFCNNSPLRYRDAAGAAPYDVPLTVVVAQGMGAFTTGQQHKTREALEIAMELVARTRDELGKSSPGAGVLKAFAATFGELPADLRTETIGAVVQSLDQQWALLSAFGTPQADVDIELFDGPSRIQGRTIFSGEFEDSVERIGLSRSHLERDHVLEVAYTLIHETSHATRFTVDTHYYRRPDLVADASATQVWRWSRKIRKSLARVARHAPCETASTASVYRTSMQAITANSGTVAARRTAFLADAQVRASLLQMNADTYAALVSATRFPARLCRERSSGRQAQGR